MVRHLFLSLALLLASTAWAQPGAKADHSIAKAMPSAGASRPDPADPQALVPAMVWQSGFSGLQSLAPPPPALGWKAANDQVLRIGGWRVYAREAAGPQRPASAPSPAASKP